MWSCHFGWMQCYTISALGKSLYHIILELYLYMVLLELFNISDIHNSNQKFYHQFYSFLYLYSNFQISITSIYSKYFQQRIVPFSSSNFQLSRRKRHVLKFWQFNLTADECFIPVNYTFNLKIKQLNIQNNCAVQNRI